MLLFLCFCTFEFNLSNEYKLVINTKIIDIHGDILTQTDGEYDNYKKIYQEYVEFAKDSKGNKYQAGIFFSFETSALSFRKGGEIMDNMSKFVGHIVE